MIYLVEISFLLIFVISLIELLKATYGGNKRRTLIFKTSCSILFWLYALAAVGFSGAGFTLYSALILAGLTLSIAGDVFLVFDGNRCFAFGLSSFFAAHAAYSAAFISRGGFNLFNAAFFIVIGLWAALTLNKGNRFNLGSMRLPANAYMLILSFMVSNAAAMAFNTHSSFLAPSILTCLGAALFFFSDFSLASEKFSAMKVKNMGMRILVSYYLAQFLVGTGIIFFR